MAPIMAKIDYGVQLYYAINYIIFDTSAASERLRCHGAAIAALQDADISLRPRPQANRNFPFLIFLYKPIGRCHPKKVFSICFSAY
jgi:hypothetical protein